MAVPLHDLITAKLIPTAIDPLCSSTSISKGSIASATRSIDDIFSVTLATFNLQQMLRRHIHLGRQYLQLKMTRVALVVQEGRNHGMWLIWTHYNNL